MKPQGEEGNLLSPIPYSLFPILYTPIPHSLSPIPYFLKEKNGNKEKNSFPTPKDDQPDVRCPDGNAGDEYLQRGA